jgi:hypothetical protein
VKGPTAKKKDDRGTYRERERERQRENSSWEIERGRER